MLTAAELASMRATVTSSFPDRATRYTRNVTETDQGGTLESWAAGTAYPCALSLDRRPGEFAEGQRPVAESRWKVRLPWDTTILPTDRLRIGGVDYEVTDTDSAGSEALSITVYCRRLL